MSKHTVSVAILCFAVDFEGFCCLFSRILDVDSCYLHVTGPIQKAFDNAQFGNRKGRTILFIQYARPMWSKTKFKEE